MASMFNRLFFIARLYTVPSWMVIGLLAHFLATGSLLIDEMMVVSVVSPIFMWLALIYLLEYFHRDVDGRPSIPLGFALFFSFLVVLAALSLNSLAIVLFALMPVILFIYSSKVKPWFTSPFVFVFRGLNEVLVFLFVLVINAFPFQSAINYLPFIMVLYFVTLSRNIIGDLRDMAFDKYTFPKRFGPTATYALSFLLNLFAVYFSGSLAVSLPLLCMLGLTILRINAYLLHKVFVMATAMFLVNYLASVSGYDLLLTNLVFVVNLAAVTYDFMPRKSNPVGYNIAAVNASLPQD